MLPGPSTSSGPGTQFLEGQEVSVTGRPRIAKEGVQTRGSSLQGAGAGRAKGANRPLGGASLLHQDVQLLPPPLVRSPHPRPLGEGQIRRWGVLGGQHMCLGKDWTGRGTRNPEGLGNGLVRGRGQCKPVEDWGIGWFV